MRRSLHKPDIRQNRPIFVQLTATDGMRLYFKLTYIQLPEAFTRTRATHGSKRFLYLALCDGSLEDYEQVSTVAFLPYVPWAVSHCVIHSRLVVRVSR
jgi:hypothetical protein